MNIFITNDDGINAEGIRVLAKKVSTVANVYVVAPDSPRSAVSHAITLHKPIIVNDAFIDENITAYAISGTPVDCVKVGIEALLKDVEIDLVLSGINNGPNLGTDVLYSGTVAAAIEGHVEKKPSIALSCDTSKVTTEDYSEAADYVVALIKSLENNLDKLKNSILNVNFPKGEKKGVKVTKLGERVYDNIMDERENVKGQRYVWICGDLVNLKQDEDSDIFAVENGYISITPIHSDFTRYNEISELKEFNLEAIKL